MKAIAVKALAAASLSLLGTAPVAAQEVSVYFGDLDISTAAGAETLNVRLLSAIDTICERPFIRDLKRMAAWSECKDSAMSSALEQLAVIAGENRTPSVTVE
jgi:UrcA family protein